MIRHIVAWNFKDGFSDDENKKNALEVKTSLEELKKIIGGIVELQVHIDPLPSSTRNVVLNSLFENEEALAAYQIHEEHKKAASFVGTVMKDRVCIDLVE